MKKNKRRSTDEVKILQKSAKIASSKAIRASRAMGLTIKIISNNKILEKSPDGEIKVLRELKFAETTETKGLKKGDVLCPK